MDEARMHTLTGGGGVPLAMRRRSRLRWVPTVIWIALSASCGGDGPGGSTPTEVPDPGPLAPFVGTWNGVDVVHTQEADSTQVFDLIANGGTLVLVVSATRRYMVTVTFAGDQNVETGGIGLSGTALILSPQTPEPRDDVRVQFTLSGSTMTLVGDSEFDFDGDQVPEETVLRVVFERVAGG